MKYNFVPIYLVDVEIGHRININVCTKSHGNSCYIYDALVGIKLVD